MKTVTTDGYGNYSITIPTGWSGTVTPSRSCYTFDPPSRSYSSVTVNALDQNYTYMATPGCVPGTGKYDDIDPGWSYVGTWISYSGSGPYNSSMHYTSTVGNTASFTFSGTQFVLTYTQNTNRGNIDVYVDGNKMGTINANGVLQWQKRYTSLIYPAGTHVVQLKHAGGGTYIDVDAIQILDTPIPGVGTYDDADIRWYYTGGWSSYSGSGPLNNSMHYTSTVGNTTSFTFSGTQFILTYTQNTNRGNIDVYVDGSKMGTINANGVLQWQKSYTSPIYPAGTHVVQLKHAGGGTYIDVDAIQIK